MPIDLLLHVYLISMVQYTIYFYADSGRAQKIIAVTMHAFKILLDYQSGNEWWTENHIEFQ